MWVGYGWVGFTFDERGFGFVDGHGGFEGRRGTEGIVGGGVSGRDRHVASEAVDTGFGFLMSSQRSPLPRGSSHVPTEVCE